MYSYHITDIKSFTSSLFVGEVFDSFLMVEADFITDTLVHMDGKINKDYYDDEKPEEVYACWRDKKNIAYQIIKGKRLPLAFKLVLCLSKKNLLSTANASGTSFLPDDIENFYMNISYKNGILTLTSGMSMRVFTMDKSLPEYWDRLTKKFLIKNNISFE